MGNDSSKGSNSPRYQQQIPTRTRIETSAEAINYSSRERAEEIIRNCVWDTVAGLVDPSVEPYPRQQRRNIMISSQQRSQTQQNVKQSPQPAQQNRPSPQPAHQDFRQPLQLAQQNRSSPQPAQQNRPTPQPVQQNKPTLPPAPTPSNLRSMSARPASVVSNITTQTTNDASSNIGDRERNPYSFTYQQLSNTETKPNIYPDLRQYSQNRQNNDSITNGHSVANLTLTEEPSAPAESLLNERQGRGAIPKQRAPRSSQFNEDRYKCRTCKRIFGTEIYQCTNGHSSCGNCKQTDRRCGDCGQRITDTKNFALQDLLLEMGMKPKAPITESCPYSDAGCTLRFKPSELQDHLKECPFQDMDCPIHLVSKGCNWIGKQKNIDAHFQACHPEHLQGDVNRELFLINIAIDTRLLYLINIGPFKFLVHIKVCTKEKNIYTVAQFLGTKFSAKKWLFEIHVYNKREPKRKYTYTDTCRAINESVDDLFRVNDCGILPMPYAMTFVNESRIAYKFFIRKVDDDVNDRRRERSRAWRERNTNKQNQR